MAIIRKTISIDETQDAWVKAQVASGKFASDSEVMRAAIKHVRDVEQKREKLIAMIEEGFASGICDQSAQEVIAEVRAECLAK